MHDSFPRHLGRCAQTIYSELHGTDGLTREELKRLLRIEHHFHVSGREIDEALLELKGATAEHKKRYVWRGVDGRYHLLKGHQDPYIRAMVIHAVMNEHECEGANLYYVLQALVRLTHLSQDVFLDFLCELQRERLVIDEGGGRFAINPEVPAQTYATLVGVLSTSDVQRRVTP